MILHALPIGKKLFFYGVRIFIVSMRLTSFGYIQYHFKFMISIEIEISLTAEIDRFGLGGEKFPEIKARL